MNELPPKSLPDVACPECKAALPAEARFCWLCGAAIVRSRSGAEAQPGPDQAAGPASTGNTPETVIEPWEELAAGSPAPETGFNPAAVLPVVLAAIIILGVWLESPGLGMLLAIIVGPALLATYAKSWSRDLRRRRAAAAVRPGIEDSGDRPLAPPLAPLTTEEKATTFLQGILVMTATVAGTAFLIISVVAICALVAIISIVGALLHICGLI